MTPAATDLAQFVAPLLVHKGVRKAGNRALASTAEFLCIRVDWRKRARRWMSQHLAGIARR